VDDLNSKLPTNFVLAAAVKDEASKELYSDTISKFEELGSTQIMNLQYREGWAFIAARSNG
jgi:hypothetical protein